MKQVVKFATDDLREKKNLSDLGFCSLSLPSGQIVFLNSDLDCGWCTMHCKKCT